MPRKALAEFYAAYIGICNRHLFDDLAGFVHERLVVNGQPRTTAEYISDLYRVTDAFPDYEWTVQHLVIEAPWLSVHLSNRGTHLGPWLGRPPSGEPVTTEEFAMYRIEADRIAEIWSTADNARLLGL